MSHHNRPAVKPPESKCFEGEMEVQVVRKIPTKVQQIKMTEAELAAALWDHVWLNYPVLGDHRTLKVDPIDWDAGGDKVVLITVTDYDLPEELK